MMGISYLAMFMPLHSSGLIGLVDPLGNDAFGAQLACAKTSGPSWQCAR